MRFDFLKIIYALHYGRIKYMLSVQARHGSMLASISAALSHDLDNNKLFIVLYKKRCRQVLINRNLDKSQLSGIMFNKEKVRLFFHVF